jgi:GNAT superfamily N-acetyltransferase
VSNATSNDGKTDLSKYAVIEVTPEWAERFRNFCQVSSHASYTRPELGITADLFSKESFDRPEVVAYFEGVTAATESTRAWIAIDDGGEIIGSVAAKRWDDHCELRSLYVAAHLQRRGLGRELYERVLRFSEGLPIRLDVVEFMLETVAIYEHWGFVVDRAAGRPRWIWTWWPERALTALQGIYMVNHHPERVRRESHRLNEPAPDAVGGA